ncbi:MAG: VTT domain-containing protein [Prevotellaceae bacterium]|jgi:shikimate dehydrogenase|nr:VTT domain-containing protein [Prevotellaceae bacterium]
MPKKQGRIPTVFVILVVCAACVSAQGADIDPNLPEKISLIEHIENWYANNMTYPVITLLMALESSFLGIIPSELIVSAAAYVSLDSATALTFRGVVVAATVGSLLGGMINYTIAALLGRKALYMLADSRAGRFFLLNSNKLIKAETWFVRYSKLSVCIGRLAPGVRQFISIPAGLARMKLIPFALYTIAGSGVWNTVLAAMGYFLHGQQDLIEKYTFELSYFTVIILILILAFFVIKNFRNKRLKKMRMQIFGLTGYPLKYSMSKKYFSEKFTREKIDARFDLFEIRNANELENFIQTIKNAASAGKRKNMPDFAHNLAGFNVTFPLKEIIIPFLDEIDPAAMEIGAVNCVKVIRKGDEKPRLKGYNTDTLGFEQAIKPYLDKNIKHALVCGTGGASKAITAALKRLNIPFTLVSRSKTEKTIAYSEVTKQMIHDNLLIVNATNVGFGTSENQCVTLPYQHITPEHLLYDVIYNPDETLFLRKGRERGARTINGSQMFAEQAAAAWKTWVVVSC